MLTFMVHSFSHQLLFQLCISICSDLKGVQGNIVSGLLESLRKVEASAHEGGFLPDFDDNISGLSVIICNL